MKITKANQVILESNKSWVKPTDKFMKELREKIKQRKKKS